MIKVIQYGEGNFLRAFLDYYFDILNEEGNTYEVNIIKPVNFGNLDKFNNQNNKYHVVLRGSIDKKPVELVRKINVVANAIDPFINYEKYILLAKDKDLKLVVSNTTEAGICFNENDSIDGFDGITFPAKVTKFLYERYLANLGGLYFLPVELIENNADKLYECINKYISLWNLPEEFRKWNDENNYYCNTLVDRIVSGYPKNDIEHIDNLLGEHDELVTVGEPFGLWVIQNKGNLKEYIKDGNHGIEVLLVDDISYYKKRKVRILNGSHTNLVPIGLIEGKITVYDCVVDPKLNKFYKDTLEEEIIPFISSDIDMTKGFAASVEDRFMNPFLNHQLTSIALNSVSKWKARDLPSFKDYYQRYNKIPSNMVKGFACLVYLYKSIYVENGKHLVDLKNRTIEIIDDLSNMEYFINGHTVSDFMKDVSIWGEDLTNYPAFLKDVNSYITKLENKESLL